MIRRIRTHKRIKIAFEKHLRTSSGTRKNVSFAHMGVCFSVEEECGMEVANHRAEGETDENERK